MFGQITNKQALIYFCFVFIALLLFSLSILVFPARTYQSTIFLLRAFYMAFKYVFHSYL